MSDTEHVVTGAPWAGELENSIRRQLRMAFGGERAVPLDLLVAAEDLVAQAILAKRYQDGDPETYPERRRDQWQDDGSWGHWAQRFDPLPGFGPGEKHGRRERPSDD